MSGIDECEYFEERVLVVWAVVELVSLGAEAVVLPADAAPTKLLETMPASLVADQAGTSWREKQANIMIKETTLERDDIMDGWSKLPWSGCTKSVLAWNCGGSS